MEAVSVRARRWPAQAWSFMLSVRGEMQKVVWPSREELIKATRTIIILSVALGLFIGWMDLLFNLILVDGVAKLTK